MGGKKERFFIWPITIAKYGSPRIKKKSPTNKHNSNLFLQMSPSAWTSIYIQTHYCLTTYSFKTNLQGLPRKLKYNRPWYWKKSDTLVDSCFFHLVSICLWTFRFSDGPKPTLITMCLVECYLSKHIVHPLYWVAWLNHDPSKWKIQQKVHRAISLQWMFQHRREH